METGSRAAAAGGVTTMVALPNTDPVIDECALVEFVARRAREIGLDQDPHLCRRDQGPQRARS